MIKAVSLKKTTQLQYAFIFFTSLLLLLLFVQNAFAQGVFEDRKKAQHKLSGVELNRLKAEFQIKFGQSQSGSTSYPSKNPWEKKKHKAQASKNNASWGDCREYALHKRNRCYREGRDAYRCEQMYETRSRLCDKQLR